MKIKEKTDRIQWFLDFINCDFEKMDYIDNIKWLTQLFMIVKFGRPNPPPFKRLPRKVKTKLHNEVKELYEEASFDEYAIWMKEDKLVPCHKQLKEFFLNLINAADYAEKMIEDNKLKGPLISLTEKKVDIVQRIEVVINNADSNNSFSDRPLEIVTKASTDEDTLIYHFSQTLDGIPAGAFRQCEEVECNKWYAHISKKERKFCSQTCATKDANRKKKEKVELGKARPKPQKKAGIKRSRLKPKD